MSQKRERGPATDWTCVTELADRLRLSDGHTRKLLREHQIPATKLGRKWLIPTDAADAFSALHLERAYAKQELRTYPKRTIVKPIRVAGQR